jgi:perosamine synthetase
MLCCSNRNDYERALRLRWFAIDRREKAKRKWQAWDRRGITFNQDEVGYKYQPTDIDASIGIVGLENFDENLKHRNKLVAIYRERLVGLKNIELLETGDNANWLFMVKVKNRDKFAMYLFSFGIETNVAHIRNDLFNVFGGRKVKLPNMEKVEDKYICLPLNSQVTEANVHYICGIINQWSMDQSINKMR